MLESAAGSRPSGPNPEFITRRCSWVHILPVESFTGFEGNLLIEKTLTKTRGGISALTETSLVEGLGIQMQQVCYSCVFVLWDSLKFS